MPLKKKKPQLPQQSANEEVLELVSLELAIPKHLVKEVVNVQSEYSAEKIKEGGFEGILWPLFGKLRIKVAKVYQEHNSKGSVAVRRNTQINK